MRLGTSGQETKSTFSIQRDRLGTDAAWRLRRSAASAFLPEDFFPKETPVDESNVVTPGGVSVWRPLVAAIVIVFSIALFMRFSPPDAYVGSFQTVTLYVIFAFLLYAVYIVTIIATTPRTVTYKPAQGDKWRYIVPGWSTCHISIGTDGLAVDGTHFFYFFEWADLRYVEDHGDRLVLRNFADYYLAIPERFFEPDRGGDIGWSEFKNEIRKLRPEARWSTHDRR